MYPGDRKNIIAAFLFAGTGILLYCAFAHWAYDDPFITFRYARNLRAGLGFVYNPGERVLSRLLLSTRSCWPD